MANNFKRYIKRNFSKISLILTLMILEFFVLCTYHQAAKLNEENEFYYDLKQQSKGHNNIAGEEGKLQSILSMFQSKFMTFSELFDRQSSLETEQNLNLDPSRRLVRDRQPAGDFVHYTDDQKLCGRKTSTVLFLVFSKYNQIEEREAVRRTWGSVDYLESRHGRHHLEWKRVFIIANYPSNYAKGVHIENELSIKNDTLRVDLMEHRFFEIMKFYSALTWALNSCRFKFLLTVEMENFVKPSGLYSILHHPLLPKQKLYAGQVTSKILSLPDESTNLITSKNLTFVTNGAILLSRDLLAKAVPLLRKHYKLKYDTYEHLLGNVVSMLEITCKEILQFIQKSKECELRSILTKVLDIEKCFYKFKRSYYTKII
uniref:Hexosyltransferase n=1 Tax=Clytia hemisphaerica TaxID=252671 RepID=A0A7M5VEZ2_9CNID